VVADLVRITPRARHLAAHDGRMRRSRRKHPNLLRLSDHSPEPLQFVIRQIGDFGYRGVANVHGVEVFVLEGERGVALLAESQGAVAESPGRYRGLESLWIRPLLDADSYLLEARLHSWDAGTYAATTGDRAVLELSRSARSRLRDERSAEAAHDDTVSLFAIEPGAVPALLAGLPPGEVAEVARRFAPALLAGP
jgi:hypothetical protein